MRNLTTAEIEVVSGGSGFGKKGIVVNVGTVDILNHNDIKVGDVASNLLNGNSFLNDNAILNDLVDILS